MSTAPQPRRRSLEGRVSDPKAPRPRGDCAMCQPAGGAEPEPPPPADTAPSAPRAVGAPNPRARLRATPPPTPPTPPAGRRPPGASCPPHPSGHGGAIAWNLIWRLMNCSASRTRCHVHPPGDTGTQAARAQGRGDSHCEIALRSGPLSRDPSRGRASPWVLPPEGPARPPGESGGFPGAPSPARGRGRRRGPRGTVPHTQQVLNTRLEPDKPQPVPAHSGPSHG